MLKKIRIQLGQLMQLMERNGRGLHAETFQSSTPTFYPSYST